MKKSLLSLCMMLLTVASWAQNWTAPTENDYPHSTPVYVQVKVNGEEMLKGVEVAAFIDDECRASLQSPNAQVSDDLLCYQLRVWGDTDTDLNKTITFKVYYNGLVFKMKKTITFTGETYSEIPLVLNIDCPTGVSLPDPLELEEKLPFSYDLTNDIEFLYEGRDASGATVSYTPLGESEIETELTYSWDFSNSSAYFTVEGNKLQALQETPGSYLGLKIKIISDVAERVLCSTYTNVVITQPVVPVKITFPANLTLSKFKETELPLTLVEGDNFDPELIEIEISYNGDIYKVPGLRPIRYYATSEDNLTWNFQANLIGYYDVAVLYDGEYMLNEDGSEYTQMIVPVEIPFNHQGWAWIYFPGNYSLMDVEGKYHSWMNQDENNRVIDLRSQTDLLYNDPTYGFFGTITELDCWTGMYKVKAAYEDPYAAMFVGGIKYGDLWQQTYPLIKKGYNWIGYPSEWDITIDQLNTRNRWNNPSDGDKIIGKTGFAEFDAVEGLWLAQEGFTLQAGMGYLYYSNRDDEYELDLIVYPDMAQARLPRQAAASRQLNSVWKYDAGAFADNMAVVARIEGLENPENYSIGAFVNGECRGEGSVVSNGRMMISVAGTAGEKVSFRIYNKVTGEFADVAETVKYAQALGSLKAPLALTVPEVTGISSVVAADKVQTEGIYDMNGRRINSMTQSGVYVVKTMEGGKIVTKKVVVK